MALPRDLGAEDYRRTHEQFNRGLMHIAFYWTIKLTHLEEVPTILFAMASTDKDVVDRALDKCVGSTHDHPRIVELNSEPLLSQSQEWRALPTIDDLESFPELLLFVARLAFAITSDRPQEEQHARLNRTGKLAPLFTAPYNSWRFREPLLEKT